MKGKCYALHLSIPKRRKPVDSGGLYEADSSELFSFFHARCSLMNRLVAYRTLAETKQGRLTTLLAGAN